MAKQTTAEKLEHEKEQQLIEWARSIVAKAAWALGEAASEWYQKYARGRTDADLAELLDVTRDYVYERRRVYETFNDVRDNYPHLSWSHFKVCVPWQDSAECLAWAEENQATVKEMKAWRRLQHGEDLTAEADGDGSSPWGEPIEEQPARQSDKSAVRTANSVKTQAAIAPAKSPAASPAVAVAPGRDDDEEDITIDRTRSGEPVGMDPDSTVKRCTIALERIVRLLNHNDGRAWQECSEAVQSRFQRAADEFYEASETALNRVGS